MGNAAQMDHRELRPDLIMVGFLGANPDACANYHELYSDLKPHLYLSEMLQRGWDKGSPSAMVRTCVSCHTGNITQSEQTERTTNVLAIAKHLDRKSNHRQTARRWDNTMMAWSREDRTKVWEFTPFFIHLTHFWSPNQNPTQPSRSFHYDWSRL